MVNKSKKVMHPNPTFQDIEDQYEMKYQGSQAQGSNDWQLNLF